MQVTHFENNAAVVRSAYAAFARRDLASALALMDPNVEWIQPDVLPWGGVYRGPDQLARFFATLGEHVEGGRVGRTRCWRSTTTLSSSAAFAVALA
jgi:ketosteroid isomerase-like protein